ncbi:MAG: hypothetical protein N2484_03175 [Clostridia bacterium]|nr:hypothetical protein [Clostridia bacterium]
MVFLSFAAGIIVGSLGMLLVLHWMKPVRKNSSSSIHGEVSPYDDINFLNTKLKRVG